MASFERPRRPASITVLAVSQLIVGGVGLVYELFKAGGSLVFLANPSLMKVVADANPVAGVTLQAPYFLEVQSAAALMGLVLSVVLIVDGIGLILLRRWAYNLGVLYGWLSIVYQVVWLAYLFLVVQPVVMAALENLPLPPQGAASGIQPQAYRDAMKIANVIDAALTVVGLTYPIFVLIMLAVTQKAFRRPKLIAAGDVESGDAAGTGAAEGPPRAYGDLPPGYEPDDRMGPTSR